MSMDGVRGSIAMETGMVCVADGQLQLEDISSGRRWIIYAL